MTISYLNDYFKQYNNNNNNNNNNSNNNNNNNNNNIKALMTEIDRNG